MKSRRNFVKSMLAVPFIAGNISPFGESFDSISKDFGYKFKLSLNVYSFNSLLREGKIDLFDLLDFCAKYNFDAIDPTGYYFPGYPEVPSDDFIREFKRKAFLLGLDISGTGIRNDFTNPDKKSREADIQMNEKWIIASAKMGAPLLRVFTGKSEHEGFSKEQAFEWMAEDFTTCCKIGEKYGVIVALQNHNEFLKTADDVNKMMKLVDSRWFGLNLDIGSFRTGDPYEEIKKTLHHAVTWQIKENVWINGNETPTNFNKLFKLIKESNYRGYLPMETLGAGDPYQKVPALLNKVQSVLDKIKYA